MAETTGSSAGRKRTAAAVEDDSTDPAPIVQLSFAQLCGCEDCWKKAAVRPSFRHSARLRAKKQKPTGCLMSMAFATEPSLNAFVYEGYELTNHPGFSPNGRYMYSFTEQAAVLLVDLWRNTYRLWKAPTKWLRGLCIETVVVVALNTILVQTVNERYGGISALHLIRLPVHSEAEVYERTLLHNPWREAAFILTEINGEAADVKQAALGYSGELVFLRLDLDEPRATVLRTTVHPELEFFFAQMSEDGKRLYTLDWHTPKVMHVYHLEEHKWTKQKLRGVKSDSGRFTWLSFGAQVMYAGNFEAFRGVYGGFLCRCNFEAKKWDAIPFGWLPPALVFPIVNPVHGKDDGVVAVERSDKRENGHRVTRFKIERFMFRNPDSLRQLCLTAAHKSRELIDGKGGFQHEMNKLPLKSVLPSAFPGMKPIPVRRLE